MTNVALLTSADVAGLAKTSPRTVARWVESGRLKPAQRLPGLRGAHLFDPKVVERFLAEREAA